MNPIEKLNATCDLARKQVVLAANNPDAATPCTDFNATQLVGHMIGALDGNAAIFGGKNDGLNPFDPPVYDTAEFAARFDTAHGNLVDAVSADGKLDEMVSHPASPEPMPAGDALMFVTWDMYIHSWDLAQANGDDAEFPDDIHAMMDGFSRQAFAGERTPGVVDPALPAPDGATPIQSLVAFLGRRV